jgi:prepilin peptidase CpaA
MAKTFLSDAALVTTVAILIFGALYDLKHHQIPNAVVVMIGMLFFAYAALVGRSGAIPWNMAFATVIFGILLVFYRWQWIGGGDVKLLTVSFLWTGIQLAFPFAVFLLIGTISHVAAELSGVVKTKPASSVKMKIPLAPAVAAAFGATYILDYMYHS